MSTPFLWTCPFCGRHTTITGEKFTAGSSSFADGNKYGTQVVRWAATTCPNPDCGEYEFRVTVADEAQSGTANGQMVVLRPRKIRHHWDLVPASQMKVLPAYIPGPIVEDYKEACLILGGSPKASATLARRCLQGMIRDFWGISMRRLIDEIDAIHDKVAPDTWQAIDAVRQMGNIGAHMEQDINVIVDVEPEEARLLIGLIETLVDDWYVARHARNERNAKLRAAVEAKGKVAREAPRTT